METSTACLVFATLLASACVCQSQPGLPKACKPSGECLAYGGYCISNSQKGDCHGLLFAKECQSALCSCCIEATLKRDECQEMPGVCPNGTSVCQDKDAGYECVCNAGFETTVCGDIDECDSNPCGPNSQCQNTDGSYECVCDVGYEKVNGACADINECLSNVCVANSNCKNTPGSYQCPCLLGFNLVLGLCEDINECMSTNITCSIDEKCENTQGSYTCTKKCPADETYIPLPVSCGKRISGNMTNSEAQSTCAGISMQAAIIFTNELINFYGDAFLSNIGDSAWVFAAPGYAATGSDCARLTKTANSTVAGLLNCNTKLPYVICFKGLPP